MSIKHRLAYCSIASVLGIIATEYKGEMQTSAEGLAHIAKWEQCVSCTYKDHVGVPTLGMGSTRDFNGKPPVMGRKATDDEVARLYMRDVKEAEQCVNKRMGGRNMPQSVFDASVSIVYNVGCAGTTWNNKRKAQTNIRLAANAGDWSQVCYHMGGFIYAGGKVSNGLKNRRAGDQALCIKDLYGNR